MALNHIPNFVMQKLEAVNKYPGCPYCEILGAETNSTRRCFENESFIAFAPFASRFNYELWIFPKKHYVSITELDDWEILGLAQILKKALLKLKSLNVSYNMFIHNSPQYFINNNNYKPLHFHIEICPRIGSFGGFEFGAEIVINTVSPETAARYYRGEP